MLSDHDFELLIADLLTADEGHRYEAFTRGADGGIDLRHMDGDGLTVVQCKHMLSSSISQLKAAAKKEKARVDALDPRPARYRFVTSRGLSPNNKTELRILLSPWIVADDDILGADDLEGLLNSHPSVERAHIKLWLGSAPQLDERIHASTWARSRQLRTEISAYLPRYVENDSFTRARKQLREERVLVVSGPPGIGKTTLARMLMADASLDRYEPIEVTSDIEEAFAVVNDHDNRIFYYDDFLGSTFLQDRLAKNEDKRLSAFMRRCAGGNRNLLILTTREHILQQAVSWYEELERSGLPLRKFLLELSSYSRYDRARIFYNHIWFSQKLNAEAKRALLADHNYLSIIDHPNYSPRLIEYITGLASRDLDAGIQGDYVGFATGILDNPELIWEHAFTKQLDSDSQAVLVCAATVGGQVEVGDLQAAFSALRTVQGVSRVTHRAFLDALRVLDDSFLTATEREDRTFVGLANPSVGDFVAAWLCKNADEAIDAIRAVAHFEQLTWLHRRLAMGDASTTATREALLAAAIEKYDAQSITWHEVYYGARATTTTWSRWRASHEDRLVFIDELLSQSSSTSGRRWFADALQTVASGWVEHIYDAGRPVQLLKQLRERGYTVPVGVMEAARDGLRKSSLAYGWNQLARFRSICPEVFDAATEAVIADECRAWANTKLVDPEELEDDDALREIRSVADSFNVVLDSELLGEAEFELENRPRGEDADDSDRETWDGSGPDSIAEAEAIESLFAHLLD